MPNSCAHSILSPLHSTAIEKSFTRSLSLYSSFTPHTQATLVSRRHTMTFLVSPHQSLLQNYDPALKSCNLPFHALVVNGAGPSYYTPIRAPMQMVGFLLSDMLIRYS